MVIFTLHMMCQMVLLYCVMYMLCIMHLYYAYYYTYCVLHTSKSNFYMFCTIVITHSICMPCHISTYYTVCRRYIQHVAHCITAGLLPLYTHARMICQETARATANPRVSTKSSSGLQKSNFYHPFLISFVKITFQIRSEQHWPWQIQICLVKCST